MKPLCDQVRQAVYNLSVCLGLGQLKALSGRAAARSAGSLAALFSVFFVFFAAN